MTTAEETQQMTFDPVADPASFRRASPAEVDSIVVELGSGVVLDVSRSLLRWSRYDEHELVGLPLWETLALSELGEELRTVHQGPAGAGGVVEGLVHAKDGTPRATRWAQVAVPDGSGAPSRMVMTELGAQRDGGAPPAPSAPPAALSHDQHSALDRVTRGLLETLSHELRTPVASVAGYAELLREGEAGQLTMMQRKFVAAIARNSERLRVLSDQLLIIGGLQSRATQLSEEPVDLREVVSAVRVAVATSGLERVTVSLEPGDAPVVVIGDRDRLVQAVEELVVNAAKFTLGNGHVTCSTRIEGDRAVVDVTDDGVGFGEEDQDSLFLPFYRSQAVVVRGVPGAGLGLTVVAAVVHGHGGEIAASALAEGGSRFTITLPWGELDQE